MKRSVVLEVKDTDRFYMQADRKLVILDAANFTLLKGEMVALVAPSGTGKSTLLHIAALLERSNRGDIVLLGSSCSHLNENQRTALRCNEIGFIYQFHHLLPEFNAIENVMLPRLIQGIRRKQAFLDAKKLLDMLGLSKRYYHRPSELSGGEQQRVAIARAVVNSPSVLFADEPTGNLDEKTADYVFEALHTLVHETGLAALIATHNFELAARMDRRVTLSEGKIIPL